MRLLDIMLKRARIQLTIQERVYLLRNKGSVQQLIDKPLIHWIVEKRIHSMDAALINIELDKLEIPTEFTTDEFNEHFIGLYKTDRNLGLINHE